MKVLVTGRGTGGSWAIRGEQMGRAIGATVLPNALDVGGYDLAVLVKRPTPDLVRRLHGMQVPIVWDVVDAYPQPQGNKWDRGQCMYWLQEQLQLVRPAAIVAATRAMAKDCQEFGVPVLALPHHAWEGQGTHVVPDRVRKIGYQGGANYLGWWGPFLERECQRRGWEFVVNPPTVAALDIVVAVREDQGYAPRAWKSNVKLANAQGCGTPIVCNREAGYEETARGGVQWADNAQEMWNALDALAPASARRQASAALQTTAPRLADLALTYRAWLRELHA